jgi:putative nucleotidyltransferase with HDIG domain
MIKGSILGGSIVKRICVEYIVPGMRLAKGVKGLDGTEILSQGITLGDKEKMFLMDAGIDYVYIEGKNEIEEQNFMKILAQDYVFKFFMYVNPDSNLFAELYKIVVELVIDALNSGWEPLCEEQLRAKNVERMRDLFFKNMGGPEDIIKHELSLASFPDVYFKLKKVLESSSSSAKEIAKVVSADVALSTKLLKLVNSPLFALTQKVDSIERAVSLVGEEELSTLALGITAIRYFKDIPPELIDMHTFWKHSLSCAVFAKIISSLLKEGNEKLMFTAGLLHDIGKLILFKNMPYASVEALIFARENMIPVVEAEESVLGFSHTDISNLIMKNWHFPQSLIDIVGHHHAPEGATNKKQAIILQLADNMANAVSIVSGGTFVVPGMEDEMFEELNLKIEEIRPIISEHNGVLKGLLAAIL